MQSPLPARGGNSKVKSRGRRKKRKKKGEKEGGKREKKGKARKKKGKGQREKSKMRMGNRVEEHKQDVEIPEKNPFSHLSLHWPHQ